MTIKGAKLEEMVRAYFDEPGSFAVRGAAYKYEGTKITDVDVWVYRRSATGIRTRCIVDIKDRRSPKTYERILWVRGMQLALNCDQAFVATTNASRLVTAFARRHGVVVLPKVFLASRRVDDRDERLALEDFAQNMAAYQEHKLDGDWVKRIYDSKAALISLSGYRAFNKALVEFRFFGERASTRQYQQEQVTRGLYMMAAVACIALDSALVDVVYADERSRYRAIADGVTYGEVGDAGVRSNVADVLNIIEGGLEDGRVVARRARELIEGQFETIRADIVAEHFARVSNCESLLEVARELDGHAHVRDWPSSRPLSTDARTVLGVLADFAQVDRRAVLNTGGGRRSETAPGSEASTDAVSQVASEPMQDVSQRELFAHQHGERGEARLGEE